MPSKPPPPPPPPTPSTAPPSPESPQSPAAKKPATEKPKAADRLSEARTQAIDFFKAYAEGVNQRDLTKLFDREATHAVTVLAGDDATAGDQDGKLRPLRLAWAFFRGLAFKLSPPRRVLFGASLLLPLLGLFDFEGQFSRTAVAIDFEPVWFLLGLAGMTLLLALELVDRLRVRDELEVARALQRDLLPDRAPAIEGWSVAHSARTANEIGGDYYDFIPLEDGRMAIAVGDASGHGIGAGLLMAIASATFETALDIDPDPVRALRQLNRVLYRTGGRRAFMTFFYGLLDPATGDLEYAIAGHPFPLLVRPERDPEEVGRGGLPLGLRAEVEIASGHVNLAPGDLLVIYTDGLPEAASAPNDVAFGFDRVAVLASASGTPESLHRNILDALDRHRGDEPLIDDLTLVVLGRDPS